MYALEDANLYNERSFDHWLGMGHARSLWPLLKATRVIGVTPCGSGRNAFYGDISTVAHVTQAQVPASLGFNCLRPGAAMVCEGLLRRGLPAPGSL